MRIQAELLLPGRGNPVRNAVVIVDGTTISYAGPAADAPASTGDEVRVPVVMPGLWDCHTHFSGLHGQVSTERIMLTPAEVAVARSVKDAEAVLAAGFTSVRELGGYGVYLARVIDEGTVVGPTVYAAGRIISPTGGHSDAHGLPYEWVVDPGRRDGMLAVADGVPECLRAVRKQLRLGAKVIKVCASGGVLSELDHPLHQQFGPDELRAVVEEAGRAERIVAAHCHGKKGIMAALEAGCRTIEHGTHLDDEAAQAMKEAGAVLVATRTVYEAILSRRDSVPPSALRKLDEMADRHLAAIATARDAGVTVAAGTDLGTSSPGSPFAWGRNGAEFAHLVAAGFTPAEAIEAGTANAPLTLGPQAPKSGLLAPGHDADVIALSENPLDDVTALTRPTAVTHVWKSGRLVKQPVTKG